MKRALLVIDVQNIYFSDQLRITWPEDSFANILRAMDEAEAGGVPVVVVQHSSSTGFFAQGSYAWELHPEIAKRPYDLLVEKTLPGSFTGTALESWLREKKIDRVVIAGYMTQMCCDTTSRQAFHRGFSVEFLSDATGTLSLANGAGSVKDEELHRAILVTQQFRFAEVLSTNDWMERLKNEQLSR